MTGGARPYRQGGYYQTRAADELVADGYVVWQTRGSKTAADLLAAKPGQLLLVQVKGKGSRITHSGWNELIGLAISAGGIPVLADFPQRGVLRLRVLLAPHKKHSQIWPCRPFITDEAGQ